MNVAKYFWDLNNAELAETRRALQDPDHPRFAQRMVTLLSRCDQPKELFSMIPRDVFIKAWPKVRSMWMKKDRNSTHRDWWETLYEQAIERAPAKTQGAPAAIFRQLGTVIKEKRIELGLSQKQLAQHTGLNQPVISQIEEGKKNLTLFTLVRLCKSLGIKTLPMS